MYATITQLEDRLTARMLGTRVPEAGADRERVLTAYIESAGAVIDAALSAKYITPAQTTPREVSRISSRLRPRDGASCSIRASRSST